MLLVTKKTEMLVGGGDLLRQNQRVPSIDKEFVNAGPAPDAALNNFLCYFIIIGL